MQSKKQILGAIAGVARRLGRTPSLLEFVSRAGIAKRSVLRLFPKWNDAVRAAGLKPCRLYSRPEDSELLEDWGEVVRNKRKLPLRSAYLLEGKYESRTLERRFGGWVSVPEAFRSFAKGRPKWADVVALLPVSVCKDVGPKKEGAKRVGRKQARTPSGGSHSLLPLSKSRHAELKDRPTYGNPIDFRGLRHEPVNEQGVVLLFGMLAKELGYIIQSVQTGFPDCEAMRQVAPERWQRVHLEFEYESKNFHGHGHPAAGCDVIVCWRHNWDGCPESIEVVELAEVMKSLGNSAN